MKRKRGHNQVAHGQTSGGHHLVTLHLDLEVPTRVLRVGRAIIHVRLETDRGYHEVFIASTLDTQAGASVASASTMRRLISLGSRVMVQLIGNAATTGLMEFTQHAMDFRGKHEFQ